MLKATRILLFTSILVPPTGRYREQEAKENPQKCNENKITTKTPYLLRKMYS